MLYSRIEQANQTTAVAPLLILHGFLGMSDNWKTLATQYAAKGFEVHAIDLRNHGRSFQSPDFSYALMATDILEYCAVYNLTKINIIGHSMGGKVAMLFAVQNLQMIDKLIIADIGPKYYEPHHQEILAGLAAVNFDLKPSRTAVDKILENYIPDFGTRQFLLKNLYWQTPEQLAFRFNLKDLMANANQIGQQLPPESKAFCSTLFIRGANSNYILDEDYEDIKQHFPAAVFETIAQAGHWLHAEKPQEFFEKTIHFLQN